MDSFNLEDALEAMSWLDPDDTHMWLKVNAALYSGFGTISREVADQWSCQSSRYKIYSQDSLWRGFERGTAKANLGTLIYEAKAQGWKPSKVCTIPRKPVAVSKSVNLNGNAARQARRMLDQSTTTHHPYLTRKGFPDRLGHVLNEMLLVPRIHWETQQLASLERIYQDGKKLSLKGGICAETAFSIGQGCRAYLCEGYSTGLSINAALELAQVRAKVIVCFSAVNLPAIAKLFGNHTFVIADHDKSRAGQEAAEKTGLPWWMPPELGDANDYHQTFGLSALTKALHHGWNQRATTSPQENRP